MKKRNLLTALAVIFTLALVGCGAGEKEAGETTEEAKEKTVVTIGCMAREEQDILFVAEQLKDTEYDIQPQIFSDAVSSNNALEGGEIDANFNQHINYLKQYNEQQDGHLVAAGEPVSTYPFGIYSRKYESLDELPDGAVIAISNDGVNRTRELKLLEAAGLIEVAEGLETLMISDVTSNPRNLDIMEIDTNNKWGIFDDVDCVLLNAITVYLNDDPEKPAHKLAGEDLSVTRALAGTLVAVREGNEEAGWIPLVNEVMHSDEYAKHLADTYNGAKVPMFETDAFVVE